MREPLTELAKEAYARGRVVGGSFPMTFISGLFAVAHAAHGEAVWAVIQWLMCCFFGYTGWHAWRAHRKGLRALEGKD